jgi:hypothetical protein
MERAAPISASGGGVVVQPAASAAAAIVQSSFYPASTSSLSVPRATHEPFPTPDARRVRGMG